MTAGIYCIENLINGKKYIGQGYRVEKRMIAYHYDSPALNKSVKKYGKENFKFYIVILCEKKELNYYEKSCIKIFCSHVSDWGYNILWGGNSPMSEEAKQKISESHMGMKNPFYGKKHTNKSKEKMSKSRTGKIPSDETRKKVKH